MPTLTTAREFLRTEPARIKNAVASLDHVLAATSDDSLFCRMDQQADWVIGELRAAITRIERAKTAVAAARALAEPELPAIEHETMAAESTVVWGMVA